MSDTRQYSETQVSPRTGDMTRISQNIWKKYPHHCWLSGGQLNVHALFGISADHFGSYRTRSGRVYAFARPVDKDTFIARTKAVDLR